jgi:hypothetical protein
MSSLRPHTPVAHVSRSFPSFISCHPHLHFLSPFWGSWLFPSFWNWPPFAEKWRDSRIKWNKKLWNVEKKMALLLWLPLWSKVEYGSLLIRFFWAFAQCRSKVGGSLVSNFGACVVGGSDCVWVFRVSKWPNGLTHTSYTQTSYSLKVLVIHTRIYTHVTLYTDVLYSRVFEPLSRLAI